MNTEFLNGHLFPHDGQWIHIAPYGRHPHEHALQVFLPEDAEMCVRTFHRDIAIDAEHESLKWSEAYGWVTRLEARDDGLWGLPEWTDLGEQAVGTGRFRFLSPVWNGRKDAAGNLRPTAISSVALTNVPNLEGLQPISTAKKGMTLLVAALRRKQERVKRLGDALTKLNGLYFELLEKLADSDLERFSDVIADSARPGWRAALLEDRDAAILRLEGARQARRQKR